MKRKPKSRVPLTKGRSIPKAKPYPRIPEKTKKVRKRPTKQSKPVKKKVKVKKRPTKQKQIKNVKIIKYFAVLNDVGKKKVLIGVPIYNRKKCLIQLINEFVRTKVDMNLVYLFDDGSPDKTYIELVKRLQEQHQFHLIFEKHVGTWKTLPRMVSFFEDKCDFLCYIEDDAIFSLNWFEYGVEVVNRANRRMGFFSLYSPVTCGHYKQTNLKGVKLIPSPVPFYGAVCCLINMEFGSHLKKMRGNPDMILLRGARTIKGYDFFKSWPTVVDHTGRKGKMNRLYHHSQNFYGTKKDALKLL